MTCSYVCLEAQLHSTDVANRSLFYGAKLLTGATNKHASFSEIPQVSVITLLDSSAIFEDDQIVHVCELVWESHSRADEAPGISATLATDKLRFVLVELAKVRKRYNELSAEVLSNEALAWFYLLTSGFKEEGDMQAIAYEWDSLEEFAELYGLAINDPKTVEAFELALECWREEESRERFVEQIRQEGRGEGLKEGIEQGLLNLVRQDIISASVAAEQLGITEDEVKRRLTE